MKAKLLVILLMLGLAGGLAFSQARGQAGGFTIVSADESSNLSLSGSPTLTTLIGQVAPRFVIDHANASVKYPLTPFSAELGARLNDIQPRFVIDHANASQEHPLGFPMEMIGDTLPPAIAGITSSGGAAIQIETDEFTVLKIRYGPQSGSYPNEYQGTLFFKLHEFAFPDLAEGETVYYRVRVTDLSGNTFESAEQIFTVVVERNIFVPVVMKD